MSKRIFWERYLMKKFALLNMQSITVANDSYFWILTRDAKPTSVPWVSTDTGATFKWTGQLILQPDGTFSHPWRDNVTTTITNELRRAAGSDSVSITVNVKQDRDHWTAGHRGESDTLSGGDTSISWNVTILLDTIKAGRLEVKVAYGAPALSYEYSSSQQFWDFDERNDERLNGQSQSEKIEVSTTGSNFAFSIDGGKRLDRQLHPGYRDEDTAAVVYW
ncbi:MAG: hypothetical protein M1837_003424 [Sclerophora amabilis]|nr:MAG: hypothetical protein M1837_003424 [Sclerophora amabilis]